MDKNELREKSLAVRESFDEEFVRSASLKVQENLFNYIRRLTDPEIKKIFTYYPHRNEIDVFSCFFGGEGMSEFDVYIPKCDSATEMSFCKVDEPNFLKIGKYGIPSPVEGAEKGVPGDDSIILIPSLVASRSGYRVGYGAGFYDRWLKKGASNLRPTKKICILYDQFITQHDFAEDWDESFGVILTESRFFFVSSNE